MNYIYDVVLNFTDYNNYLEFYEWSNQDSFVYIEKIPIYKINTLQMKDIMKYRIKINNSFLNSICDKTYASNGDINYSFLVTDMEKVIALMFNSDGELIKKSSLLIDEEDAVIDESSSFINDIISYEIIGDSIDESFFTRKEKTIQSLLINEINSLYENKQYDEITYLYYEIFNEDKSIYEKYMCLINEINHNNRLLDLYNIIKLTQ